MLDWIGFRVRFGLFNRGYSCQPPSVLLEVLVLLAKGRLDEPSLVTEPALSGWLPWWWYVLGNLQPMPLVIAETVAVLCPCFRSW